MTPEHQNISIRPLNREEAHAVAAWRYGGELAMYDGEPDQEEALLALTAEGYGYYALVRNDDFVGYCCFGPEGRVPGQPAPVDDLLDLGGGLRPDLVGKGLGALGLPVILAFARQRFSPPGFRTAIASFNRRSIVLCRWAGFRASCTFAGPGGREYTELVLERSVGDGCVGPYVRAGGSCPMHLLNGTSWATSNSEVAQVSGLLLKEPGGGR